MGLWSLYQWSLHSYFTTLLCLDCVLTNTYYIHLQKASQLRRRPLILWEWIPFWFPHSSIRKGLKTQKQLLELNVRCAWLALKMMNVWVNFHSSTMQALFRCTLHWHVAIFSFRLPALPHSHWQTEYSKWGNEIKTELPRCHGYHYHLNLIFLLVSCLSFTSNFLFLWFLQPWMIQEHLLHLIQKFMSILA